MAAPIRDREVARPAEPRATGRQQTGHERRAISAAADVTQNWPRGNSPVDEEVHKRVRELLNAGLGIRATARHADCSTTTVCVYGVTSNFHPPVLRLFSCHEENIPPPPRELVEPKSRQKECLTWRQ